MADEIPKDETNHLPEIMAEGVRAHQAFVSNMIALDYAWRTGRLEEYLQKQLEETTGLPPRENKDGNGADTFGT